MKADPAARGGKRHRRLQAAMARRGVGALLLATPHLAAFASGARRVQVAGSGGGMPWVVIAAGTPSAVIFTTDPDGAPPWMPRELVEPLRWDRDRQLGRISELLAATEGALASDILSPAVAELAGALGRKITDAAPILAEAALPRTAVRIALIERALAAARRALRAAMAAARPGATPAHLVGRFAAAMSDLRAGFPLSEGLVWRVSSEGGEFERLAPGEPFHAGDVLALELGLFVEGHAGVAGDTVACGGRDLSPLRRRWFEALCAIAKRCRPGATTADLRAAAVAAGAAGESLLAWGLGVGIEPPYVDLDGEDVVPLTPGTILVLAPAVGGFRATRALLMTDGSPRWLEAAP